ncbi:hypothetical protein GQ53DRAFT_356117 [Thozetella sp. PMI_491]|nr:hypothetical protein GQ53DRAFT_356117 [Thozetella sp. PMI_491]
MGANIVTPSKPYRGGQGIYDSIFPPPPLSVLPTAIYSRIRLHAPSHCPRSRWLLHREQVHPAQPPRFPFCLPTGCPDLMRNPCGNSHHRTFSPC